MNVNYREDSTTSKIGMIKNQVSIPDFLVYIRTMTHLKDEQYYSDLYDKFTVERCRRFFLDVDGNKITEIKELTLGKVGSYFYSGERYINKRETIEKWMEDDRKKDELLAKQEPLVYCPKCHDQMKLVIKELDHQIDSADLRVMYLYRCDPCKEKRGIYSDGSPYVFKTDLCPKCNSEWESIHKRTKDKIVTTSKCKKCGNAKTFTLDLNVQSKKEKTDTKFEEDRKKFCFSAEEGEEYRSTKINLTWLSESFKDKELHKAELEKAKKTQILTVAELSQILSKQLAKENYGNLAVSNPDLGRDLVISFTVQDMKAGRAEYDSTRTLKKLLAGLLADTNWHLTSDGLRYKLGILSGRLRGQDSVEHIYEDLKQE